MEKFIDFCLEHRPIFDANPPYGMVVEILHSLIKTCHTKSQQPWSMLPGEIRVCAKLSIDTIKGLRMDHRVPWEDALIRVCTEAIDRLVAKGVFESRKEGARCLTDPIMHGEFDPEKIAKIAGELIDILHPSKLQLIAN